MNKRINVFYKINTRILIVLLVLFAVAAGIIGVVNNQNIRNLYEESYTERLLLTNALMGAVLKSETIEYFVELMKNQDDGFKTRQVEFYHDREELFRLQREDASQEEQQVLLDRLAAFHGETQHLKNQSYWNTLNDLKELKEVSRSTYVYVMADTGLKTRDGDVLYTYIFDAEDAGEYNSPDMDGLGTSDIGNEAFDNVFVTKKQTEQAEHYEGDFGELYFVCVPIINEEGQVVAVLGTDLSLEDMNSAISSTSSLFNWIIIIIFIMSVLVIFAVLSRSIARPISSLTETALVFAEGNLHASISESALKQRTEIGMLAHAIKNTLDATTLYLNSIPESIFIMNRDCETYFRNDQFVKRFGQMQAQEFMGLLFAEDVANAVEESLKQEYNTATGWIDGSCFAVMLKEITLQDMTENSILVIANDITDLMQEKENAQAAAAAKSNFLSRMSHEMRTPMNGIIGMAKVAEESDNISNIKHCLSIINGSSQQLLNIINDVLDMSKIEAGKLELENAPVNLENLLMRVCNMVIDSLEKKKQNLNVVLSKYLKLYYIADELRLSQVLINLLSNAVKFTPEGGQITLTVDNMRQEEDGDTLLFSVEDTGIGMTGEQIARLFDAFEQADGSITRKFSGIGLGLAISQSIVEKMGGHIEVESRVASGSVFRFAMALQSVPYQDTIDFGGIRPEDIRVLIVDQEDDERKYLTSIAKDLGIYADATESAEEAAEFLEAADQAGRGYDLIFLHDDLPDARGIHMINKQGSKIDKDCVIMITTYSQWHHIEKYAHENDIRRYIAKPIFPSSVLDSINYVVGEKLKSLNEEMDAVDEIPDLSGVRVLLAEDIDVNIEVFLALMEGTNLSTDIASNGLEAVTKFKENSELYDLIIMDIQMPEMNGYEATKAIRAMDLPWAKEIPIMAMSANAFKEDIDRCLESGMNDHVAKPIDADCVIAKIVQYARK